MVNKIIRAVQLCIRTIRIKWRCGFRCVRTKGGFVDVSLSSRVYGKRGGSVSLGKGVTINRNAQLLRSAEKLRLGESAF